MGGRSIGCIALAFLMRDRYGLPLGGGKSTLINLTGFGVSPMRTYLIVSAIASLWGFATMGIAGAEVSLVVVFWYYLVCQSILEG